MGGFEMLHKLVKSLVLVAGLSTMAPIYAVPIVQMDMDILKPGIQSLVGVKAGQPVVAQLVLIGDGQSYAEMKINVSWNSNLITLPSVLPLASQYPWYPSTPTNPYFQSYFEGSKDITCSNNTHTGCAPVTFGDVLINAGLAPAPGFAFSFGGFDLGGCGGPDPTACNAANWQGLGLLPHIANGQSVPLLWIAFNVDPRIADSTTSGFILPSVELTTADGAVVSTTAKGGTVPEPATLTLMGIGLIGLRFGRRRAVISGARSSF